MKKIVLSFAIMLLCAIWACEDRDDNLMAPNIRIENTSDQNFSLVQVRSETDSLFYENINSGSFSDYLQYEIAYRQDTLTIEADSTQLRFVPDSISDPLPLGLYTYQIGIDEEGNVSLTFKVD